jgi:hypothetical protein
VATELGSHNTPEVRNQMIDPFYEQTEVLAPEDIAGGDLVGGRPERWESLVSELVLESLWSTS